MDLEFPEVIEEVATMFLGVPVPSSLFSRLEHAIGEYPNYIDTLIPADFWNVGLLDLGRVENPSQYISRLIKPLPQAFVPTVQINCVGRGLERKELWAHVHKNQSLIALRKSLVERLGTMRFPLEQTEKRGTTWQPHVVLASLYNMALAVGIADVPTVATFAVSEVCLYREHTDHAGTRYTVEATIPL